MIHSPNSFSCRASDGVGLGPSDSSPEVLRCRGANFCAQAADLVRVTSLPSARNGRSRHFRQKNIYVLAHFLSKSTSGPPLAPCLPDASQMPPRCLPDASQMPPRCLPDAHSAMHNAPWRHNVPKSVFEGIGLRKEISAKRRYGSESNRAAHLFRRTPPKHVSADLGGGSIFQPKNQSLRIGLPGGQNVSRVRTSRLRPLIRPQLPLGPKSDFGLII